MEPENVENAVYRDPQGTLFPTPTGKNPPDLVPSDRLESWKEIAAFLGRDERTAMRWEELGLPVRRVPGSKRGRVYASRAEIADWLAGRQAVLRTEGTPTENDAAESHRIGDADHSWTGPRPRTKYVVWLAACVGILTLAAVGMRLILRSPTPTNLSFGTDEIEATDANGRLLWSHRFRGKIEPALLSTMAVERFFRIADLRGDGDREVLVAAPLRLGNHPDDPLDTEVDCFSGSGQLLWSYLPRETFWFGDHMIREPWIFQDMFLSTDGPNHTIWMAFAHYELGDSYVVSIDPRSGHPEIRYVNTGTIRALRELQTPRGAYVLAGGFNNEHDGASLAIIDEKKAFAASPQTIGTRHRCRNCPEGSPDFYFVFPRSELNLTQKVYECPVWGIDVGRDGLSISVLDLGHLVRDVRTIYQFRIEPAVVPVSVIYSSGYDILHHDLERSHQLGHRLEDCPERLRPAPIRMWTPAAGWQAVNRAAPIR